MSNYFVIGASRGLGLELVRQILKTKEGSKVIAGARKPNENAGLVELKNSYSSRLSLVSIDVSSDEAVGVAAKEVTKLSPNGIDYIILNAGLLDNNKWDSAELNSTFNNNTVSLLRVAHSFIGLIRKGEKKVIMSVSSKGGSALLQNKTHTILKSVGVNQIGYRVSKGALNMLNAILAQEYLPEGITFVTVHPGTVQTDLYYNSGIVDNKLPSITVAESINGQLEVLLKVTVADAGKFLDYTGEEIPF